MKFLPCLLVLGSCITMAEEKNQGLLPSIPPSEFSRAGHTTDDIEIVRRRVKSKAAVLLDVREKNEWDSGHLKDAKLVPLSAIRSDKLTAAMKKSLSKDKPVYVHCRSGGRVLTVSKILRQQGYDIRPLKLGYQSLLKRGFEKAMTKPGDGE